MSETLLNAAYSTSVSGLHAAGTAMQAMKQALEALENGGRIETNEAITALRLAIEQAEKQAALDRMADNARELGLDYEPAALKVHYGEVCYKSKEDDQSYGMWVPVTPNNRTPFAEGTEFFTTPHANTKVNSKAIPEQISEPVAYVRDEDNPSYMFTSLHEPQEQTKQEPVAKVCHDLDGHIGWNPKLTHLPDEGTPLYAAPPRREWVGLTDEEVDGVKHTFDWASPWTLADFARAIEAKLREKNA